MGRERLSFPTVVHWWHGISDRRCRYARAQCDWFYAQSGEDDRGHVPDERPPYPLEERRTIFYAKTGGWRYRCEQRGLAVVCGNRSRCRSIFPGAKSLESNEKLRSSRQIYQDLAAGAERCGPDAIYATADRSSLQRLSDANRRSCDRTLGNPGTLTAGCRPW